MARRAYGTNWVKPSSKLKQIILASTILASLAGLASILTSPREGSGAVSWDRWQAASNSFTKVGGNFSGNLLDLLPNDGWRPPLVGSISPEASRARNFSSALRLPKVPLVAANATVTQRVVQVIETRTTNDHPVTPPPNPVNPDPDPDPSPDPDPDPTPSPSPSPTPPPDDDLIPISPPPTDWVIPTIVSAVQQTMSDGSEALTALWGSFTEFLSKLPDPGDIAPLDDVTENEDVKGAQQTVQSLSQTFWDALESMDIFIQTTLGPVFGMINDVTGPGGEVEQTKEEALSRFYDTVTIATQNVNSVTQTVSDQAAVVAEQAGRQVEDATAPARQQVDQVRATVDNAVASASTTITSTVKQVSDAANNAAQGAIDTVTKTVTSNPTIEVVTVVPISPNNFLGQGIDIKQGHTYVFRVQGTYKWSAQYSLTTGQNLEADASCAIPLGPTGAAGSRYVHTPFADDPTRLNLQVDGKDVAWKPLGALDAPEADGTQLCSADHAYEWSFGQAAQDATLVFKVRDDNSYNDNAGSLVVEVHDSFVNPLVQQQRLAETPGGFFSLVLMLAAIEIGLRGIKRAIRRG